MESTAIRINSEAHTMLCRIARQSGESMQASLTKAIELYRRQTFLQKVNVAQNQLTLSGVILNTLSVKANKKERNDG